MSYETVIGLEVHVELKTESKIFCSCSNEFGKEPNTSTCPVCLGLPGALPVLNKKVLELGVMTALAINAEVSKYSKFDRKNYFYPDQSKNFQTSQFDLPICENGYIDIDINGINKRINITRAHMEEDAGKLIHGGKTITSSNYSNVDYNRCGVPLLEIVSEPELSSGEEAKLYIEKLRGILTYIDVSDCKMEEGSIRCDANVSVRKIGDIKLGERSEIKNLNSLKSLVKAIEFESKRQIKALEKGERIVQETRTWDDEKGITLPMRSKEDAHDYRYFPEPDLPPIILTNEYIEGVRRSIPELPDERLKRMTEIDNLSPYDCGLILSSKNYSDYYDEVRKICDDPKQIVNFLMGDYLKNLKEKNILFEESKVKAKSFGDLINMISAKKISGKIAKNVIIMMIDSGDDPEKIVKREGLVQITDQSLIEKWVDSIIVENPKAVEDFNKGKGNSVGFLVGQVMKKSQGKANPSEVSKMIKNKLEKQS